MVAVVAVATPAGLVEGRRTMRVNTLLDLGGPSEVASEDILRVAGGDARDKGDGGGHVKMLCQ